MTTFIEAETRKQAIRYAKENGISYAVLKKVCGGYKAFETITDYEIWENQK